MAGENVFLDLYKNERWMFTWARIVARAWEDPDFGKRLVKAKPEEIREICAQMGYDLPDHLDVSVAAVEDDKKPEYEYPSSHPEAVHNWRLPSTAVTLILPPAPTGTVRPMALINYLRAGAEYPFTTAC